MSNKSSGKNEGIFKIDWDLGTPEVAFLSVIFVVVFGFPLLLSRPEILLTSSVVFYILLYIIGFFGHVDDISSEGYKRVKKDRVITAIAIGLFGYLAIQLLFFVGLTLLATSEESLTMDKWELLIFNITFVVSAEELVFRDTVPFILTQAFNRFTNEYISLAIAFGLSSVLFGSFHIWTYGFDSLAVGKAILSGIFLSIIRIFGGLLSSYIAHMTYNGLNIIGLFMLPF